MINNLKFKELQTLYNSISPFFEGGSLRKALKGWPVQRQLKNGSWKDVGKSHLFNNKNYYRVDPEVIYVNCINETFKTKDVGYYWHIDTGKVDHIVIEDVSEDDLGPIEGMTAVFKTKAGALYGIKEYEEIFGKLPSKEDKTLK